MKKTDIYRLHNVVEDMLEGRQLPRRAGKTTAQIHTLAGYVELGSEKKYHLCSIKLFKG